MNWQNASVVFKLKQERATDGRLKPRAVVIGRTVVADCGVIAADREIEVVIMRVLEQQAFDINAKGIVLSRFKDNLAQEFELLGHL